MLELVGRVLLEKKRRLLHIPLRSVDTYHPKFEIVRIGGCNKWCWESCEILDINQIRSAFLHYFSDMFKHTEIENKRENTKHIVTIITEMKAHGTHTNLWLRKFPSKSNQSLKVKVERKKDTGSVADIMHRWHAYTHTRRLFALILEELEASLLLMLMLSYQVIVNFFS